MGMAGVPARMTSTDIVKSLQKDNIGHTVHSDASAW